MTGTERARSDRALDAPGTETTESGFRIGRWPVGILIIALLRIIDAVSMAAVGTGVRDLPMAGLPVLLDSPLLTQSVDLVIAAATIVGVLGLLAFRRWGWVLTMVLVGVGLLGELVRVAHGQPDYLGLLLLVVSAFYLNQRSVRAMAGRHLEPGTSASG
ncbi:MAG TPA: hypothetical protein VFP66_04825 [Candidatus Limnocylindrales bacterium]|nr:hypothetical protein [Candidatus Limnocylindrales bacterium]